jgi:glycosyltransferase involved in cell wall biosynthesis
MKICIINAPVGTISGSQETVIFEMARHLAENNDVTLITGRSRAKPLLEKIKRANFQVVAVPFWGRGTLLNRFFNRMARRSHPWKIESATMYYNVILRPKVKKIIQEANVIVTYYRLDARLFSNIAYKYGVPCVSNFQFAGFGKEFFKADKSVMYLANSQFSKKALEKKYGITVEGVITPGVSSIFFENDIQIIDNIGTRKSLLFVGNLRRQKGIFELIDIFKGVSDRHSNVILVMVGKGEMEEELKARIKTLGLTERVRFAGEVNYEDMPPYYKSAKLLVHPTQEETFGMVVLEAMAVGLPVVATDLPALREVTEGGANLLPIDDLDMWVEKIDTLLNQENIREEMVKNGKKIAGKHLWSKKGEQLERHLEKAAQYKGKLR